MLFLRVIVNRKEKLYSLGTSYACLDKEWDSKRERYRDSFEDAKNANAKILSIKSKASWVLANLELKGNEYTIHDFHKEYTIEPNSLMVLGYFDKIVDELKDSNYGNSRVFIETKNSLSLFLKEKRALQVIIHY